MAAEVQSRKLWSALGIVVLLIPASHLFRFFTQRSDIWWNPKALAVPLAESKDRVEIYVQGRLLEEQLRAQRLQVLTDQGSATLNASDIRLRFNNHDRVRAEQTPLLIGEAVVTGVVGAFVGLSMLGMWPPTRRRGRPE